MSTMLPKAVDRAPSPSRLWRKWAVVLSPALALTFVMPSSQAAPDRPSVIVNVNAVEGEPFDGVLTTLTCPVDEGPARNAHISLVPYPGGPTTVAMLTISGQLIEISGSLTYPEEGSYDGGSVSGSYNCGQTVIGIDDDVTAEVADAPLHATGQPFNVLPGQGFSGAVATFTDADPGGNIADYGATITWGDGTSATGSIAANPAGGFEVQGSHTYATTGSYQVTVAITDFGSSSVTAKTTAVIGPPPTASFTMPTSTLKVGHPIVFNASGSHTPLTAVAGYRWTLTGPSVLGGTFTATCPGYDSGVQTSFHEVGKVDVNLQVTYSAGLDSSTAQGLVLTAGKTSGIASRVSKEDTQWMMCTRLTGDPAVSPTGSGGPPKGCQDEYFDGPIDAVGCFTPLADYGQIPAPEYKMMCPFFAQKPCALGSAGASTEARKAGGGVQIPPGLTPTESTTHCPGVASSCNNLIDWEIPPALSTQTVRVNGLDITPDAGAAFVLDQNDGVLASSDATISLLDGQLPLSHGPLLETGFNYKGDIPLLDTNLTSLEQISAQAPANKTRARPGSTLSQLLDLGGFLVDGTLTVDLVKGVSHIGASLLLPHPFQGAGGSPLNSQITLTADNQNGLVLDDLLIQLQGAYIGGGDPAAAAGRSAGSQSVSTPANPGDETGQLQFDHLAFCYQKHVSEGFCQKQTGADFGALDSSSLPSWNASADINLLGAEVNAAPPPPDQGVGFVGGQFDFGGLTFTLPDPGIPLGSTGVSLTSLGATLGLHPTRFSGTIGLTAEQFVSIDGTLFMVFASPSEPYTFTGTELGGAVTLPTPTVTNVAVAAGGDIGLNLPVLGDTKLLGGYTLYAYPAYLAAGGGLDLNAFGGDLVLIGVVNGQIALNTGMFDIEGQIQVHTPLFDSDAEAVVSSIGIAACGSVSFFGQPVAAEVGYKWGGSVSPGIGSCDLTPYQVVVTPSARQRATPLNTYQVTVPAGLTSEMIKLTGSGGAPDITIKGPGGIHASTAGGTSVKEKPFVITRVANQDTTYIAIIKPPAGSYAISENAGSPAITQILTAQPATPSVHGQVTGRGRSLVLHYSSRGLDGQHLVFFERSRGGLWTIGTATAGNGTLKFSPAPGPAGTQQIVAELKSGGAPVVLRTRGSLGHDDQIVVTSYHAPGPPALARVAHLSVRHVGAEILVKFAAVRRATQYGVTVRLSSGQHWLVLTTKRSLAITGVPGEISGTVAVQALGNNATTQTGPAATAKIAAEYQIKRHLL